MNPPNKPAAPASTRATTSPESAVKPGAFDYEVYAQRNLGRYISSDGQSLNYRALNAEIYRGVNTGEPMPVTMPTLAESTAYAKAAAKQNKQDFDEAAHKRQYAAILKGYQQYQRGQFNSRNTAFYVENNLYNQQRYGRGGTPENKDNTRQYLNEGIDTRNFGGIGDDRSEADLKRQHLGARDFESGSYVKLGPDKNYALDNFRRDGELVQQKSEGGYEKVQTAAKDGQVEAGWGDATDYFNRPENNDKLYRTAVDDEGRYRVERQRPGTDPYKFTGAQAFGSFLGSDDLAGEYDESELAGIPRALLQLPQTVGSGLGQSVSYLERKGGQLLQNVGATQAGTALRDHGKQSYARAMSLQPTLNRDQQEGAFSSLPGLASTLSQGVGSYVQIALTGGAGTTGAVAQTARYLGGTGLGLMATGAAEQSYASLRQSGYSENEADLFGAAVGVATIYAEKLFNGRLLRSLGSTVAGKQLTQSLLRGEEKLMLEALEAEGKTLGRKLTEKEAAAAVQGKYLPKLMQRMADKATRWQQAFDAKGGYEGMVLNKVPNYLRPALEFGEAFEEAGESLTGDALTNLYADFVFDGQVYQALDFLPDALRPQAEERDPEARKRMAAGVAPAARKSFEQIMAGAWQSATGGYVTGAALSTLQHFRAAQQEQREQVQHEAIVRELVRSGGKGSQRLLSSIDKMEKAGQFGVGLAPNGQVPEPGQPTVNNLLAQSLRNKVRLYQNLYDQLGLQKLAGQDEKQALALLSKAGADASAPELSLKGLRSGVAVEEQKQAIEELLTGGKRVDATGRGQGADNSDDNDDSLPAQTQPGSSAADDAGRAGSADSLNLLEFTSTEEFQQDFARRKAIVEGNLKRAAGTPENNNSSTAAGADPALAAQLKQLEEESARAQDRGVVGALTRHRATGAYYEARQQQRELEAQVNQAPTPADEAALTAQAAAAAEQADTLRQQAQAAAVDNEGAQRLLVLADAQLELEARQRQRQRAFTGELMAEHVLEGWVGTYAAGLGKEGEEDAEQAYWAGALGDALGVGSGRVSPTQRLQNLTRWQQQHQTAQPRQEQQAAEQQFAQAQQATQALTALAQQLPQTTLQDEAGLSVLVSQVAQLTQSAPALAAENPDLINALTSEVIAQARRLTQEGQAALSDEEVTRAAAATLPGAQEQLAGLQAEAEQAQATGDEQALEDIAQAQQELQQQLDDAKTDVRAKYQPPLAAELEKAAARLSQLPVQAAAAAVITPAGELAADFYTGLHDSVAQPGALKAAVADWLNASPDELAARAEPALARLEQQAALNRLHLELRAQDAPALHAPGGLPKGVAAQYLTPIEADVYQAANAALREVEQDLRVIRDKFSQAASSRFGRDNELSALSTQARHAQLRTLTDAAVNVDPTTESALAPVRESFTKLSRTLADAAAVLLGNDATAAALAVSQAETQLRALLLAQPAAVAALQQSLLDTLPVTDSRFSTRADRQQVARYTAGTNYTGTAHDGIFTYLTTLLGVDPARWAAAYEQVAPQLIGADAANPGKLPSLEQQQVVRAINGFLSSTGPSLLAQDNAVAAQLTRQQQNPKEKITVAPDVLYVPGSAGTGKTTMVIRTAMLTQAVLGKRSAANPYQIVATAPHARQQQTLSRQLKGEALQTTARTFDEVVGSLRDGSFTGDALVADEVTIYSDEQTQQLLKALAGFNQGRVSAGQAPVRLIALGDPAQMAGRDSTGKRSRAQYFTDPLNRLCLSTRPLSQVYRTGIVTAYQLFDAQRQRILSAEPEQNANLAPVPGMRYAQAGGDPTTLKGVTYLRADEQRQQAAELIQAFQANPEEKRTVRLIVSAQIVQAETDALRALGVRDAGQYVLDADNLPEQGGIVLGVDQAQGGEFDFVFVAVQEQYPVDTVGTLADDAANTLRAQFVGASRMRQYASIRYEAATYGQYPNQLVDQLEEFAPETAVATTQRNGQKLAALRAVAAVGAEAGSVPIQKPAPAPATETVAELTIESAVESAFDAASLTPEDSAVLDKIEELAAGAQPDQLNTALQAGPSFSWAAVALYQQQQRELKTLGEEVDTLTRDSQLGKPIVAARLTQLRRDLLAKGAALESLERQLYEQQVELLAVPGDVRVFEPKRGQFALVQSPERTTKVAATEQGAIAVLTTGPEALVQVQHPLGATAPVPGVTIPTPSLARITEAELAQQLRAAEFIREQAQKIRELREQQPALNTTSTPAVATGEGQLLLPALAQSSWNDVSGLALEGRVKLLHYATKEGDGLSDTRYLQANQAFQARLAQTLNTSNRNQHGGNGTLTSLDMKGLPAPQGGEFTGEGQFRLVWHRQYQAYGQVDRSPALLGNFFTVEYVEQVSADGTPARRLEVGQVYKDAPKGSTGPVTGRVHRGATASPFDQQLDQLMKNQLQAPQQTASLSLGGSLPLERVKHPYYNALKKSTATPGGVEAYAESSSTYNQETLPYEQLAQELAGRGISVSSPWVITANDKKAGQDVRLGAGTWATGPNALTGSPILFYQRSGDKAIAAEQLDSIVKEVVIKVGGLKSDGKEFTPVDAVKELFDQYGLEMVLAKTDGFELELFHYQDALHGEAQRFTENSKAPELAKLLRSQLTEQGELVETSYREADMLREQWALKQMLFGSDQFEALSQREQARPSRRGLRNKVLRIAQMAGVARKVGSEWKPGAGMNSLNAGQKRHLTSILTSLDNQEFAGQWEPLSAAWSEDLFTYLNYLDARGGGELSKAWQQDSERNNNPVQLRLYGGSGESHTVPFAKVQVPAGVPVQKLVGASRLTMTGMGSVVNLYQALQNGQLATNKAATTQFSRPAPRVENVAPATQPIQPAVPVTVPAASTPAAPAAPQGTPAPGPVPAAGPRAKSFNPDLFSLNIARITQGDAEPAEAEARLRYLFGTDVEFALNKGVSFMRELGLMSGNLISLATDNGLASGRVKLATANHEAIHRVLRIVAPAYRQKVLSAQREVLSREENAPHTAAQLADDNYVEEQLAQYYERSEVRQDAEWQGEKFRANPVVKFLQGFGAGRLVLRALQAISRAANRLAANPDYLGELFTDMEKGYYQQRRVRQQHLEEKAYSLNSGGSLRGRQQENLDGLADLFGGLDTLYHTQDVVKQNLYSELFAFDPSRPRWTYAEARLAYTNSVLAAAQELRAAYGSDVPGPNDLDKRRASHGRVLALGSVVQAKGALDEDGNPTTTEKTALDIMLDHAFLMFGEGAGQGVDREQEAAQDAQGADGEENQAKINAAMAGSQDGTGLPAWEKDRQAREGATLQLHLDATPLYVVTGWEISPQTGKSVPVLTRDAQRRYVDPRQVQSILDRAYELAFNMAIGGARDQLRWNDVRAAVRGMVGGELDEAQSTAASLYLKFFNGRAANEFEPGELSYLAVRDGATGRDVTPVSFFEVVHPDKAQNVQARNAQPAIRESYAREYQKVLSELQMFFQSARNNVAADVNVIDGLSLTGASRLKDGQRYKMGFNTELRANKEKAMSVANLAGKFLAPAADGTVKFNDRSIAELKRSGFDFAVGEAAQSVVMTFNQQPFMQWELDFRGGGQQVVGRLVSTLPVTEKARVYARLLQVAGLDVEESLLAQAMNDSRDSTQRHSVLGYRGVNATLLELSTKVWSQALAMHLQAQAPEVASQHPAASVVLDPRLEAKEIADKNLEDVSRYGANPDGAQPQLVRSPTAAWDQVLELQKTLAKWAKGGQQSSVRTADGAAKYLRRFSPSMFQRWRQLQVKARNFEKRPRILAEMAKGEWEYNHYQPQLPPAETDLGLHWSGVAQGQPISWTNHLLSGQLKIADVLELNVLENPITGKRQSLVKASKGELHDAAAWYLFWGTRIKTNGEQTALMNPPKADKTSQNARLLEAGKGGSLLYKFSEAAGTEALRELHGSYVAQFYGAVVPRWEQHGGFMKPAGFDQLPVEQALAVLETHRNSLDGKVLKKSALRSGVDYYKSGISPMLKAALLQTPQQFASEIRRSIEGEARQLIAQGMRGVPEQVWKELRKSGTKVSYNYDPQQKFKAEGKENREPLQASDGTLHPLLLDYLLTHRILGQHIDTALTGHHIYYKNPVDMAKRGVLDHTAYEMPDVSNPRGLPRYGRALVVDDLSMFGTDSKSGHAQQLRGMLAGLGWSEKQIQDKLADTVNQDGLGFINPLEWRLIRESEGHKYPLREQIKRIQGGMSADGTPYVFKNSDLTLSNQMLLLGNETTWNLLAQSLGGYNSPLYQRWLDIRQGMSQDQLLREEDWEQLHQEYVASQAHGERIDPNSIFAHHIGRIVLASGNKVAAHSVQDISDVNAHAGAFEVDNLLGGRVLSLYQNPDLATATIANITQENHMLVVGGNNYQAMERIYAFLGSLADAELTKLMEKVQAAAEKDGKDGRSFFYQKAIESLTALGNISNSLSLLRYEADENVPLISKQITGAIAAAINQATKQRMSGLRATVATMTGLLPMYDVVVRDEAGNVSSTGRYTQQQVIKRGYARLSDGRTGPATLQWAAGVEPVAGELKFTRLLKGGVEASAEEAKKFMELAQQSMEGSVEAAAQLESLVAEGYALAGQEILVPRETASKFGIRVGDDVADVNEQGASYFLPQFNGDEQLASEAWSNWQQFLNPKSTRVPDTGMNSTQMSVIVGFMEGHGNTVLVPSEGEIIAGFDNDGDQTTLEFAEVRRGGLSPRPETPATLRQQMFQAKKAVFSDVRNVNQLLKPLTSDDIMALAKAADAEASAAQRQLYGVTEGFHAHGRNIEVWTNAQDGKSGVGPSVKVRETFNNLYMLARRNPAFARFTVPSYFDGQEFAGITDRVATVLDYSEQLANGALDNAKNNTLGPLNINNYTLGAYGAAGVMGWNLRQATSVLNHPAARALVQRVQQGNSIYNSKKDDLRLLDELRKAVIAAEPDFARLAGGKRDQVLRALVQELTAKHAANNVSGQEVTDKLALEHMFLLAVKGEDLLKLQRVLSPMSGVDSSDFDSENQLSKLAETIGATPDALLKTVSEGQPRPADSGNTITDPLAVLQANKFAGVGVKAMLQDAQLRQQGQIVRQRVTRNTFFGGIREQAPEAKSFKVHGNLQKAFDQVLDSDYLTELGSLPVPVSVLDNETDPELKALLKPLSEADLTTGGGRHQFVAGLGKLLFKLKTRGKAEADLFGGLGQSALVQELEFDRFEQGFGEHVKLARATEMSPEVKNFLEREFRKLTQLDAERGAYLQRALLVYQLLNQGLVTGRGSLAEVFAPSVLKGYSEHRARVKQQALAGQAAVSDQRLPEVLARQSDLVPQVFPKKDKRSEDELEADLLLADEIGLQDEELEAYLDEQDARNQVEDQSLYFAASDQLPGVLSNKRVLDGLEANGKRLLKNSKLTTIRIRNKASKGNVLYKRDGAGKDSQWIRQFPVGNPSLNLYGTTLLSPYPVYAAGSPLEDLNTQTNQNLREHLDRVRRYVRDNSLLSFVERNDGLRIMDRYGRPIQADVKRLCE